MWMGRIEQHSTAGSPSTPSMLPLKITNASNLNNGDAPTQMNYPSVVPSTSCGERGATFPYTAMVVGCRSKFYTIQDHPTDGSDPTTRYYSNMTCSFPVKIGALES
ncbi:hypothetical protein AMTR_s00010p00050670 [Amborella trichopoda]|uniref:Uncharacterized protein n=1 Tax=Amborella trichopoda TaxID=13333 RepID=W1NFS9_AMBTC|nr:hypothetical protein AMTR_s00010p00050670 [Amborella trichopoda]